MASVNEVIIVGNLGRNPEMRFMPSGDAIANITVVTSYRSRDRTTGEPKELTEWHRITLFGRLAEVADQYLKKGASVYVKGRLQTRKYTDKDGTERYATDIIAEHMQMLGGRTITPDAGGANAGSPDSVQDASPPSVAGRLGVGDAADFADDRIPF